MDVWIIEIKLPKKISEKNIDSDGKIWLRAIVNGDIKHCLAVRGIWTNVVKIIAQNGDGTSLAADSIKEMQDPDDQIVDITQPFSGFGGKKAVTDILQSSHLRARFNNRHRAINTIDYEQIVIEHFPEVGKAVCIPCNDNERGSKTVHLVIFCPDSDRIYYLSPSWKLKEIERSLLQYTPSFINLAVINPVYEKINVVCKVVLRDGVIDDGKVIRNLVVLAQNYLSPWKRKGTIPDLQQVYRSEERRVGKEC